LNDAPRVIGNRKTEIGNALRLFVKVCEAVQAAHVHGVVHRDLKPGNILIDAQGEPHILDFGLAKFESNAERTGDRKSEIGAVTVAGQFIGSLPWASPEQAEGQHERIDIRTDVYALGVLLYQLLTGQFPYPVTGGMRAVLDNICTQQPQRPSRLAPQLGDELDAIALKCLSKAREQRYQSASELARDLSRYLAGEPVEARRELSTSGWYTLRKTMRKHRLAVGTAAAFVGVITVAAVALAYLYGDQRRLRRLAETQSALTAAERDRAVAAERAAEWRRAEAERQTYIASISAAYSALAAYDVPTWRRALDQAPAPLRNWEWRYLAGRGDLSAATLDGHDGPVRAVLFSPNGDWIISSAEDQTVRIWDAQSADTAELRRIDGLRALVGSFAISPDGGRLAALTPEGTIRVLEIPTGRELFVLSGAEGGFGSVAFSADGASIATGERGPRVQIWDARSGAELFGLDGPGVVTHVVFHPDGQRLAVGYRGIGLVLWDLATRTAARPLGRPRAVVDAAFSPDGRRIAAAQDETEAGVWDVDTGVEVLQLRTDAGSVVSLAWSPEPLPAGCIATGGRDRTVRLWDPGTGELLRTLRGHERTVYAVAFSPDGARVASASRDGTVKLWDPHASDDVLVLRGHRTWVYAVAFSPDGQSLASASRDGTVRVWETDTGRQRHVLGGHRDTVTKVVFSSDGRYLASCSVDHTILLWDAASGVALRTLTGHMSRVDALAMSPDGRWLASGSTDRTVRLWELASGVRDGAPVPDGAERLAGHQDAVTDLAFSPDGRLLASGSNDRTVRLWRIDQPASEMVLRGHTAEVKAVAFGPRGEQLITASSDHTVRVWRTRDGAALRSFKVQPLSLGGLALTPDGTRLALAIDDGIKLFDVESGDEILTLRGHAAPVTCVAFSREGAYLAAGSWDSTVRIWKAPLSQTVHANADERLDPQR
jgi:WD40 repeat protein